MLTASTTESRFWPSLRWWLALSVIVLAAAALRFTGYNFSLPYVDHPDEPNHAIAGRLWIDNGSAKPIGLQGYPPGIITINYVLQRFFHEPGTPPTTVTGMVRLLAITATLGTLVAVALLAYLMSTPVGGLLAGALYGVTTILVEYGRYAVSDPFVGFFSVLAVLLVLAGTLRDNHSNIRCGVVALMLAIVFKYQAAALLPLVLLLPLIALPQMSPDQRKARVRHALANTGYLALFGFWLIVIYPSLEASLAPNWAARDGIYGSLLENALANLTGLLHWLGFGAIGWWVIGAVGLLILLLWPGETARRRQLSLAAVLAATALWHGAVSLYGEQPFRQFVGEAALISALAGASIAAWAMPLHAQILRFRMPSRLQTTPATIIVVGVAALVLIPQTQSSIANAYEHTLHDRRNDLARYVDTSLPPGPYIAERDNDKTLNGAWGGYAGANTFRHIARGNVDDRPIEEWRERGAVYAIESYERYQHYVETEAGQAILAETLLLKSYPPSGNYRGPSMVVLRLFPIEHEASAQLGPIRLVGYDIDRQTVAPGNTVLFTLYWQADAALDGEYAVYNHLTLPDSRDIVAQVDGPPLFDERRPTTTWNDPDETFISRTFTLTIPPETAPGEYRLISGFYRRADNVRLTSADSTDFVPVTTINVRP